MSINIILGTPITGTPKPWEYFDVPAIMVNAYELIKSQKIFKKVKEKGLRKILNFDGEIYVDSGGYQCLRHGIHIDVKSIAKIYKILDADYYVSLDYPLNISNVDSKSENKSMRLMKKVAKRNVRNYKVLYKEYKVKNLIPVLHPPEQLASTEYQLLIEITDSDIFAFGGLVPYFLTTKGVSNGRKVGIKMLYWLRKIYPGKIHVMGLGAPSIIPILSKLNIDSTDSSTWRLKAAYGKIILPGKGERHISSREINFGRKKISSEEIEMVNRILDDLCISITYEDLKCSFKLRALFNAYVVLRYNNYYSDDNAFRALLEYASSKID